MRSRDSTCVNLAATGSGVGPTPSILSLSRYGKNLATELSADQSFCPCYLSVCKDANEIPRPSSYLPSSSEHLDSPLNPSINNTIVANLLMAELFQE